MINVPHNSNSKKEASDASTLI